jgi:tetratricopeptide (TPR) repeat protein
MIVLRSLIVLLVFSCTGCTSLLSADIYRPIHVRKKPDFATVLPALTATYPDDDAQKIYRSLRALSYPRSIFSGVTGYYDWANYLAFDDIHDSLELFANNPFAWSLLADYLALERQPLAANVASDHAISILDELKRKNQLAVVPDLEMLYWTTHINKAIFLNLAGEYSQALDALAALDSQNPDEPLIQMAISWTRTTAHIGRGAAEAAIAEIERVAQKWPDDIADTKLFGWIDYPQYLRSERREAIFLFLRGEALLRLGKISEAQSVLEKSIKLDDDLWNSYLSLASAFYAQGKDLEARKLLKDLLDKVPERGLYSMDLAIFNFANLNLQFKEYEDAAKGFRLVIERAKTRDQKHREQIQPKVPQDIRAKWEPVGESRIVVESRNNLAATLLAIHQDRGDQKDSLLTNVDSLLAAPGSEIEVENLARSKWTANDRKGAIDLLARAVQERPQSQRMRSALLKYGVGSGDSAATYAALVAYLDSVPSDVSDEESDTLEQVSDAADVLLNSKEAREVKDRINAIRHVR